MNLGPSWALERSRFTQGRETPPQGTPWWPSCLRGSCVAGEAVSGSLRPSSPHRATGRPRPHAGGRGERGGDRRGGAAAPTHLDAALQTPPRGACRGRDWEGECEGTASPGPPHEAAGGAAPLRTHTEACHTEAGFRLLCCGEEATTPSLLGSALCRVFWTRLSHTLSQFTGNYRDE